MRRRRILQALAFGGIGAVILALLGVWQMQRLAWKEGLIAALEARLSAPPAALPEAPEEAADEYLRVRVRGSFLPGEVAVLTTERPWGPGFRVISPFETEDGRRILVDRGYVPERLRDAERAAGEAEVTGALLWPDDSGWFTPEPDLEAGMWFARDVEAMAEALDARPVMVVAETATGEGEFPVPQPATARLRNNHFQYALTWFSLSVIWAAMTLVLVWRLARRGTI